MSKCALTVVLCLTLSGLPALAQETPPPPPPAAASETGPPPTPLTLAQAVQMSLKNNLDVRVASFTPRLREQDILSEEAAFDPNAGGFAEKQDNSTPTQNVFDVEFDPNAPPTALELITVDETLHRYGMGFSDRLRWGANYSADLIMTRRTSTSANSLLPTTYFAALILAYNQSLLRGWGNEVNTTRITVARTNLDISRSQYEGQVQDMLRQTEDAYWELVFARQDLNVSLESLNLAQELLKLNRIKVQVGTLPPIEITTAEAEVASREQNVIVAENAVHDAEDTLRLIINMPRTDDMWVRPIAPADAPAFVERPVDLQRELDQAIQERPDLQQARLQVKNAEAQLRFDRRQLKWDLNGYARYQLSGLGGDIPPGGVFEAQNQNFLDALDLIPDREFPSWTLGVNVSVPIGNNAAQAAYVRSRLTEEQAQTNFEALKLRAEVEVRTAARGIDTNRKRIQAAEKNVELQRKKVEAEQKKFENGMSTSFQVLTFQQDLATALGQLNRSLVDYRKSLTALERAKGTLDEYLNVEVQ